MAAAWVSLDLSTVCGVDIPRAEERRHVAAAAGP